MASPSPRSASPPAVVSLSQSQSRSPATSMSASHTSTTHTTHTTPSKPHYHPHPHHLPVGHNLHSPAQTASGDFIQGKPSDAGGLHTSTSRGNILLPPSNPTSAVSTPADLLSVSSRSPSSAAGYSRPGSPSASATGGASIPASPGAGHASPATGIPASPAMLGTHTHTRSRPTSPVRSKSPMGLTPSHTSSSPRSSRQWQQHDDGLSMFSSTANTPHMDSSAVFERDVEFANEHLMTGSEAIDLAAAPVLSEVALAVTSDDISALAPSPSSTLLSGGGGGVSGTASPLLTQSLDSTILSSSPGLPSNAVLFNNNNNDAQDGYGGTIPLSEQLRRSSGAGSGGVAGNARPTNDEFGSPPPSLSLSPSASTNSPISSNPGSPVQALHPGAASASGAAGLGGGAGGGAPFRYGLTSMEQLETGVPMEGVDGGQLGMQSPPGSSSMSGVSLSGSKDSKRRLSMISYADIINSERLSDTHSGFSSPTPSSALSLPAAALPVQGGATGGSQSSFNRASLSPSPGPGLGAVSAFSGAAAGTGSALYSPLSSPEESAGLSHTSDLPTEESTSRQYSTERDITNDRATFQKPPNYRTDTMSTTATEVFYMPGQLPLQTPPAGIHSENKEDTDVTPTNSKIKNTASTQDAPTSTSTSSWNMVELGKALVGSAAGAVGSVLSASGIGNGPDDGEDKDTTKKSAH